MTSVLAFHAVSDPRWFDELIGWLKGQYRLVPITELSRFYAGNRNDGNWCHITVDDGDRSFYDVMFPVLKKHGVHASLFVSPRMCSEGGNFWFQEISGYQSSLLKAVTAEVLKVPSWLVEKFSPESILKRMPLAQMMEVINRYQRLADTPKKRSQNVSIDELRELAASGLVSIGAHTMNHPILMNEANVVAEYEIGASIRELSTLLEVPIRFFAYPNGVAGLDFGEREERFLESSGIEMAFTTESRHVSQKDHKLRIPRICVSDGESTQRLKAKMLLGSGWSRLQRMLGAGDVIERRRLSRKLANFGQKIDCIRNDYKASQHLS